MERIHRKNNTSSSSATQKSQFEPRRFTDEIYQSPSPIDSPAQKTIRPSLNWQNISVEAPPGTSSDSLAIESTEPQQQEEYTTK